jgi:putative spermidine/putrescine transport system ATP-binding protein
VIPAASAPTVVGKPGTFAIRPEKIRVLAAGATRSAGELGVTGTVDEVVYSGATTRIVVDAAGLQLSATVLNDEAPDDAAAASALRRGDPIAVAWHESALRPLEV